MSLRPGGQIPDFASTATFPAGPDAWALQPTKADPGTALIAQGFPPHGRLPAEQLNWLLNRLGLWLRYQDTIEVQNWSDANDPVLLNTDNEGALIWSPENWRYFSAGTDSTDQNTPKVYVSINGTAWADDAAPVLTPDAFAQQYSIAGGDPAGKLLAWINHNGTTKYYLRSGTYTASANAAVHYAHTAKWVTDRWFIGGLQATHPTLKTLTPGDVYASVSLTGSGSVVGGIRQIATDGTNIIALANGTFDYWLGTLAGSFAHYSPGFASVPTGLVWDPGDARFIIVCDGGEVYASPDGAAWTLKSSNPWRFPGGHGTQAGTLACLGGLLVAQTMMPVPGGEVAGIAAGIDKGAVWYPFPVPLGSPTGSGEAAVSLATVESRFVFVRRHGSAGSDGVRFSYSLRVLA